MLLMVKEQRMKSTVDILIKGEQTMTISRETRKELFEQMTDFQIAIFFLLEGYGYGVALEKDQMTAAQRERFERIESAYIEEQLKNCPF